MKTVHRIEHHDKPYTILSNEMLRNKALSLDARGLLGMMLSYPPDWKFNKTWLKNETGIGAKRINRIFAELKAAGHVSVSYERDEHGRIKTKFYVIHEEPIIHNTLEGHDGTSIIPLNHTMDKPYDGLGTTTNEVGKEERLKEKENALRENLDKAEEADKADKADPAERDKRNAAYASMIACGLTKPQALALARDFEPNAIQALCVQFQARDEVGPGWLISAIKNGWTGRPVKAQPPAIDPEVIATHERLLKQNLNLGPKPMSESEAIAAGHIKNRYL